MPKYSIHAFNVVAGSIALGLFQKKIPGRGRRQAIYFSMGGWCGKYGSKKKLFVAFPG